MSSPIQEIVKSMAPLAPEIIIVAGGLLGADYEVEVKAGRSIEATLPGLEQIPAAPANLATPVEIKQKQAP